MGRCTLSVFQMISVFDRDRVEVRKRIQKMLFFVLLAIVSLESKFEMVRPTTRQRGYEKCRKMGGRYKESPDNTFFFSLLFLSLSLFLCPQGKTKWADSGR